MKESVTTTEVVGTDVIEHVEELTICDKCGLEADPIVPVMSNPEFVIWGESWDRPRGTDAKDGKTQLPFSEAFEMTELQKEALQEFANRVVGTSEVKARIEFSGRAEICRDCYDELFGWEL